MGQYSLAEQMLKDTLKSRTQRLGAQHPDTIKTQEELNDVESILDNQPVDTSSDDSSPPTDE